MRSHSLAPLYRATVGFDQIADLMDRLLTADAGGGNYPPYNIEKTAEDGWRVSVAVAGFAEDDLSVEQRDTALIVTGKRPDQPGDKVWLHRGIATRAFEKRFHLAAHVRVSGAAHENGMLHIDLVRELPEALKPRRIAIGRAGDVVEGQAIN
jgi:molecular chaperone IbpA